MRLGTRAAFGALALALAASCRPVAPRDGAPGLAPSSAAGGGSPAMAASAGAFGTPPAPPAAADRDGDGVVDRCDHCPGEPGIDDVRHPYNRGCPFIDAFGDSAEGVRGPLRFARGSARLEVAAQTRLDAVAQAMKEAPSLRFFVVGHRSEDEPAPIAQRRAEAVRDALVQRGLEPARLVVEDAASAHPVFDASARADAAASRRVDFDVSRNHARERAWSEDRREVVYRELGELEGCPSPGR